MKIRSLNEIKTLDDEINLFEDDEWDFMSVIENQDVNYEYFNDIRDTDFDKLSKRQIFEQSLALVSLFVALTTCVAVAINTGILDKSGVDELYNLQTIDSGANRSSHIDGEEVNADEFIAIQNVINNYMKIIESKSSYKDLHKLCHTTSVFADTYNSNTSKIKELYDKNDCYARALREFSGSCSLNKISEVLKKDGVYYCYVTISAPLDSDVTEYVYLNQYNMLKHFNGLKPTETTIFMYLLDVMETCPLSTTSHEFCIKFIESDGEYLIKDDSFLLSVCVDAYTSAVYQISKVLGEGVTIGK